MPEPRRSTRVTKHRLSFACCGVIVGLLLAGCGDDADLISDAPTTTVTIAGPATTDAPAASSETADRNKPAEQGRKTEQPEANADRGKAETDGENQGDRPRGQSRHHAATDTGSQGGSENRESRDRGADRSDDEEEQGEIVGGRRDGEPIPASTESGQVSRPESDGPDYWELYQQEHGGQDEGAPDS